MAGAGVALKHNNGTPSQLTIYIQMFFFNLYSIVGLRWGKQWNLVVTPSTNSIMEKDFSKGWMLLIFQKMIAIEFEKKWLNSKKIHFQIKD